MADDPVDVQKQLEESDQYWSAHELDEARIAAIKDPRAQAYARAAHEAHQEKQKRKAEVWRSDDGQWYWHVKAGNGEVMAQGEGDVNKSDAITTASGFAGSVVVLDNPN